MSIVDLLEGRGGVERKILHVNERVDEWTIGDTYTAQIKFTLLGMDLSGMTLDVTDFQPTDGEPSNEDKDREQMQVLPSPS